MAEQPTHVALSELTIDVINIRRSNRGAEPIFTASIRAKGVIEPLVVRPNPNGAGYLVINGGKRLAALGHLRDAREEAAGVAVTDAYPVPVVIRDESDVDARDTSLITNIVRAATHPVDQFEAFAEQVAAGREAADIAATYAMTEKQVRQALALGALSSAVRQVWRDGKMGARIAQLFTLAGDHAAQNEALKKLEKRKCLDSDWQVRDAIVGNRNDAGALVTFVGVEAYRAAGGNLVEDLFGSEHRVLDPAIAKGLAEQKLKAECDDLAAAHGWGWAMPLSDLPKGAEHSWPRFYGADKQIAKTKRGAYGCVVSVGNEGKLEVQIYQKPEAKKAADKAKRAKERAKNPDAPAEKEQAGISNALAHRLSLQLTKAAAASIVLEPDLALAAAVAAISTGFSCVKLRLERMRGVAVDDDDDIGEEDAEFVDVFARYRKMKRDQLVAALAGLVGLSIDMQCHSASASPLLADVGGDLDLREPDAAMICNAIDPKQMGKALLHEFDAVDYFNSASKAIAIAAVKEMDGRATEMSGPKAEAAKYAAEIAKKTGWLPPELRIAAYAGPGTAGKTSAKAKTVTPG